MTTALKPSYRPAELVGAVLSLLEDAGIEVDAEDIDTTKATLSAVGLLMALGIQPRIAADDNSPAAEIVRDLLLEHAARTTTRGRRLI